MMNYRVEAWDILQHLFGTKKINNRVLHFSAEFSAELSFGRMKRAVGILADAFPLLRCSFEERRGRRPVWTDRGFAAEDLVTLTETEDANESARWFLCGEIAPEKGPQIKIGILRRGNADTLCVIINHMLCDAAGFKELLYTLATIYTALERRTEPTLPPTMDDRSVGQLLKSRPLGERLKILFGKSRLNPHGDLKFELEGDPSAPFIEMRKLSRERFRTLKEYAKDHGASVNDVMLAAFLRALFRIFGRSAALPCAIDLRRFLPDRRAGGLCNLMSNVCCDAGPDVGAGFEETLSKVKRGMDAQKTDPGSMKNIVLLELLLNLLPYRAAYRLLRKHFSNPPVAFTNIGILDEDRLVFGNAEMAGAFMTGSIKYAPNFQLSLTTFDDEATLCINLYGTGNDRRNIADFLDIFLGELSACFP